jgi:TrmH family RNA methyltransferase
MNERRAATVPAAPGGVPDRITSLTNSRVKAAVRLRDRREREATGLTIVDGAREILRALDAGIDVQTAFVAPQLVRSADATAAADRLRQLGVGVEVSPAVLEKIAFGDRSDGLVVIVRVPTRTLADLRLSDDPLVVVLEGVEKPGNLGAILRSADAAGAAAVIAADALTDLANPNVIRASVGTVFAVPVVAATSAATSDWLRQNGIRPVAAIVGASTPWTDADLTGAVAIVLGSEAAGLTDTWRHGPVTAVSVPMAGVADSLNVSTAAAVLLFEAVRQRAARRAAGAPNPAH